MPGSSLLRSLSTFGVVILGAASACVHAASAQGSPLPALAGDQGVMVTLIGTVQVEPPWDPEGEGFFSATDLFIDGEYDLRLLTCRTTRIHLNRREWQMVEFPLDVFQRERVIPTIPFQGDLRGTFYLDDMRLVNKQQLTAVEEDTNPTPN